MRFLFRLWIVATAFWAVFVYLFVGHPGPQGQPLPLTDLLEIVFAPALVILLLGWLVVWAVSGRIRAP